MDPIITAVLTIGSICSALVGISTFIALVFKKPKQWIKKWVKEMAKEELQNELKEIREILDNLIESEKIKLGHSIMTIYDRSIERGYITIADKKDLIELHKRYKFEHGNHHVDDYYNIMMDMDVR